MTEENKSTEFGQRIIEQLMELFVAPVITERQENGTLPKPLSLMAAQIIFSPDGGKPSVRINDEVKAISEVKFKQGVEKKIGDPIYAHEIDGLEKIKLTDEELDCGHATLIRFGDVWTIAFDFRYNKALSNRHISAAQEFYDAAESAFQKGHWSVLIDNLFSASELTARAVLLAMPDKEFRKKSSHKAIHSKFNRFASLGNIKEHHKDTFNRLGSLRGKARYLKDEVQLTNDEANKMLVNVREMIEFAKSQMAVW